MFLHLYTVHQHFNSHPHKEDDVLFATVALVDAVFQLTSSQGG